MILSFFFFSFSGCKTEKERWVSGWGRVRWTGLISTTWLHLITLPSSAGLARYTHTYTHNIIVTGRSLSLKHHHTTSVITQEIVSEIEKVLAGVAHLHLSISPPHLYLVVRFCKSTRWRHVVESRTSTINQTKSLALILGAVHSCWTVDSCSDWTYPL